MVALLCVWLNEAESFFFFCHLFCKLSLTLNSFWVYGFLLSFVLMWWAMTLSTDCRPLILNNWTFLIEFFLFWFWNPNPKFLIFRMQGRIKFTIEDSEFVEICGETILSLKPMNINWLDSSIKMLTDDLLSESVLQVLFCVRLDVCLQNKLIIMHDLCSSKI